MATAVAKGPKEFNWAWEGKDKAGKTVRGELRATGTPSCALPCAARESW